jgi:glycosyltransferase involved in cell wall biosynthesis
MRGNPEVRRWVGSAEGFHALPALDPEGMAAMFRAAWVSVSPSTHDGTPNSLLEAMACGCLPVAGDLESIREWIVDGRNGLLIDPGDPVGLARAVVRALSDDDFRRTAAEQNLHLVQTRAERGRGMQQAEALYRQLAS